MNITILQRHLLRIWKAYRKWSFKALEAPNPSYLPTNKAIREDTCRQEWRETALQ